MKEQKVLVIAIDPCITNPVTGKQEKASEYFGFSLELFYPCTLAERFEEFKQKG